MNGTDAESSYKTLVQGRSNVQHSKAGPDFKESQALFVKSIDTQSRRITALASSGSLDRHDEAIKPEAFKELLPIYLQNPVVITAHAHRLETGHSSVVGSVVKAWIDAQGLWVIIEFVEGTTLGNEYWLLYSSKKQRAFSVGFVPLEWEYEERNGRQVCIYTKVELLEISCVAVGANRDALSRAKRRKFDFVSAKKEDSELDELERELREADPDWETRGMELAELWLGTDIEGEYIDDEIDYAGIVKGTACGEFAKIIRGAK